MNQKKIKLNTEWLSVCGGCHVAIVDLHEKLMNILEEVEIQRCPVLTDIKDYPAADLGIITGAVRNTHDREAALKMRESCKTIIAFGTCALYGGISGAGTVYTPDALLEAAFMKNPTTKTNILPESIISPLEKIVTPLDDIIEVDLYLPGCPPHASFIADALFAVLKNRPPKARDETCCAKCNRKMKRTEIDAVKRVSDGIPEAEVCFLSQGYICLGSVTLDRCLSPCPNEGTVCTGCAGPSRQILSEPNRDIRTEVADRMSFLTKIPYEDVIAEIERASKSHYSYAMATQMIGQKPTFLIKKWISQLENDL